MEYKHYIFRGWRLSRLLLTALVLALGISFINQLHAHAVGPAFISFQGKVVNADGTNVTNGSYNFDFVMYSDPASGTPSDGVFDKWHELTKSVTVTNGVFQTNLGSATALPDFNANPSLYLAVRFNADAAGYMSPRVQMASVPYALNADKVGGVAATAFAQLAANQTFTGTNTYQPTTNITSAIIKQTSAGSPTADIFNVQTANGTSVLQVTGPVANEAAVSLSSVGATRALTLNSSSGTIIFGASTTTLQKSATAFTLDINNASNSTLTVTNAGTGVASLDVEGDVNIGTGRVYKINGTQITSAALSNDSNLAKLSANQTFTGNNTFQNTADSTSNFKILTAGGSPRTILQVGTSNTLITADANLIINSSVNRPSAPTITFSSNSSGSISGAANTTYYYRVSAIVGTETAASVESWISSNAFTPLSAPSAPTTANGTSGGISGTYLYKYTFITANGETTAGTASSGISVSNKKIDVTIATGPTGTTGRSIYRTTNGGTTYKLVTTINDNTTTLYTDSTADAGLGVAPPAANTATTNLNSINIAFSAFAGATLYRIYRGTATLGENAYQTTVASPLIDTGSAGTAGTPIEPTAGRVGIGTATPSYSLDVNGNISASNAYVQGSNVGQTSSCGAGTTYSGIAISGGIVTSVGACASIGVGGSAATLQTAYDSSTIPQIILTSPGGGLTVRDSIAGLGTDLFDIQDNSGTTTYFGVSVTGVSTTGSVLSGSSSLAGSILLSDGSSNTVTLTASGIGTNYTLTLPTAVGSVSQCLQTDSVTATQLVFASCAAGGGGANTALSNLAAVAINTSLLPATTNTIDLGSAAKTFRTGYFGTSLQITAAAVPAVDQLSITNAGQGVTAAGVNGLSVNYVGGNAAVEASGARIDLTPGGLTGGTWSGLRIVANGTGPVTGVTEYGIKLEGPATPGSGTETGMYIGTGWDTGLDVQSGGLNLAGFTSGGSPADPSTPAADNLRVYAKKVSGRMLLKIKGPSGLDSPLQPALFGNNTVMWAPTSAALATGGFGTTWRAGTTSAAASHPSPSTTAPTISNQMHRLRQQNLVTTTNQIMGILTTTTDSLQFWMGNAAGVGGFFFSSRFIVENYPASTVRIFSGLTSNAASVVTGTNIVTSDTVIGDVAGLWHDTTDASTTFNLVTRNNVTTSKAAITLSNAIAAGNSYDWYMFVKPNDTTVYYRLDDIVNGVSYEGNTSTTVPRNTVFMGPTTVMSNGTANTGAGGTGIGVVRMYIESDH